MRDKTAISKAAQKYIAKGQIYKAIEEWEKLLTQGKDGNVYNTIGDLYLKKGSTSQAINSFTEAANIFREEGFYLKAMGIYRKILNISPSETEALIALSELNVEKGLIGNANETFLSAAEKCIKEGSAGKAIEHYKKILKINPSNTALKVKMAELYLRNALKGEALNEYLSIASDYLEKEDHEKAQEFYNRVIDLDPNNIDSFIGMSRIAESTDNIEQAYKYLDKAMTFDNENTNLLFNYSRLAIETNNLDEAKQTLPKLLEIEPSNNQYKKLLGIIHLKEGLLDKAWEELLPFIDLALHTEEWNKAVELLNNFKEREPGAVKYRLITLYKEKNDKQTLRKELSRFAEIFTGKGLLKDALKTYEELRELNPNDETIKDKIVELEKNLGVEQKPPEITPSPEPASSEERIEVITPEDTEADADPSAQIQPEKLEEIHAEADFYIQQGLIDEAIKLYEKLVSVAPDNKEFTQKLESLKPSKAAQEKLEVKIPLPDEKTPAHATTESDLMDVFNKFKKGIDEKLDEKDHESHYNLGIAYKEMGLIDDAITELQIAANDPERKLQTSTMLAFCYMSKKLYPFAIKEFKKALETMTPSNDSYLRLKNDLAEAHEKNIEYETALKLYEEIHTQDPNFTDIKQKIEKTKSLISKQDKGKPKSKKNRVSYL